MSQEKTHELKPLTVVQKEIFDFIAAFINKKGIAPTVDEIANEKDYESNSPVHKHIGTLVSKGWLNRERYRWRGISITEQAKTELHGLK